MSPAPITSRPDGRGENYGRAEAGRLSQHCAARRNFNGSDASGVEHYEPITVLTAQYPRVVGKYGDDVFNKLCFIGDAGFVVRDVHAVSTDQPDAQHRSRHVVKLDESRDSRHVAPRRISERSPPRQVLSLT